MDQILCFVIYMIADAARLARPVSMLAKPFARLAKPVSCLVRPFSKRPPVIYDKQEHGKPIKILLVGYNGARNTGSDVRTAAIARQLKTLFGPDEIRITVMTLDPGTMEGYFDRDVELIKFSSFFPLDIFRACSAHHAAILCEGSTLTSR